MGPDTALNIQFAVWQTTQPEITCSMLTIEMLEQDVKNVQSNYKVIDVVLVSLLLTLNIFNTLFYGF